MKTEIQKLLKQILIEMGVSGVTPEVEIPEDSVHGDYSTNIALRLSKTLKKPPMEVGLQVAEILKAKISVAKAKKLHQITGRPGQSKPGKISADSVLQDIDHVEVVKPGFINLWLTEAKLSTEIVEVLNETESYGTSRRNQGQTIMVEYAHPNTHKAFHIGHLRNITTGEAVVRLLESTGAKVVRVNYQGDVGMHIAKCLYSILRNSEFKVQNAKLKTAQEKIEFLGKAYAAGSTAFEENETAKKEIGEINKKIYVRDPDIFPLYQETRQWSLDYFETIYKRVGTHFDRYYFESEVYESGKKNVLDGLAKGLFEKSEGAIIFPGKKFGLHNRVFITKEGNATYEAKDMGLGPLQFAEYHPGLIIHVVGPEQAGYFQVVFEALAQLFPETRGKEHHYIYGWVKLKQGKMSSRQGNVVLGEWLFDEVKKEIYNILQKSVIKYSKEDQEIIAEKASVAAVKYSFLRVSARQEIAFDLKESVSFEGDSGPYLQYTYARTKSVLRKSGKTWEDPDQTGSNPTTLNTEERALLRLISQFPEVVEVAAGNLTPNALCSYLFRLAQAFNLFYAKHSILGIDKSQNFSDFRIKLTAATAFILKNGLHLLGIEILEQM